MKLALCYIPTEVWVDIFRFPWISRKELGRIVHRFRNRKFAEFLQFYLHDWGKRTLRNLLLNKKRTIPRTPMPENIKCFDRVGICHFDSMALDFLRRISTLFISNGVNLHLVSGPKDDLTNVRTVLQHLSPLLHGIHSLLFDQSAIPLVEQYFGQQKLAQVKMLSVDINARINQASLQACIAFFLNWLTSPDCSDGPKFLEIFTYSSIYPNISTAIQQQFLSAKRPHTFAILFRLWDCHYPQQFANFWLENNQGEQLHGEFDEGFFQILRYQEDIERTKLREWMMEETIDKCVESNAIKILRHVTIGQIAANAGENEVNDAEKEDQPSTSG